MTISITLTRYDIFDQSTGRTVRTVPTAFLAWLLTRTNGRLDYVRSGEGWVS